VTPLTPAPRDASSLLAWPRSGRTRALRQFAFFLASTSAFQGSRLGLNLLAAALLPVAEYGRWGLTVVVLTYTTYANLGVLSAANRAIPILLGEGRSEEAKRMEGVAFAGSALFGAGAAIIALVLWQALPAPWKTIAIPLALAVFAQQLQLFYQVSLRARMEFDRASAQQLLLAVLILVVGLPLLLLAGVAGLVLAYATVYLAGSIAVQVAWRRPLRAQFALGEIISLIGPGLPIMLTGLLFGLLVTADRWVALTFLGEEGLGQYTLAATVSSSLLVVFTVLAQQFYPLIGREVGRLGKDAAVLRMAHGQGILSALTVAPFAVALILISPIAVPALLPQYAASVPALQVLAAGFAVLALSNGYTNMLVAVGRYWVLLLLHGVVLGFVVLAGVVAAQLGFGLLGIAWAAAAGFALLAAGSLGIAWLSVGSNRTA
jgi:O-antigen/teichoic acid export membrane protein